MQKVTVHRGKYTAQYKHQHITNKNKNNEHITLLNIYLYTFIKTILSEIFVIHTDQHL